MLYSHKTFISTYYYYNCTIMNQKIPHPLNINADVRNFEHGYTCVTIALSSGKSVLLCPTPLFLITHCFFCLKHQCPRIFLSHNHCCCLPSDGSSSRSLRVTHHRGASLMCKCLPLLVHRVWVPTCRSRFYRSSLLQPLVQVYEQDSLSHQSMVCMSKN